MDKDPAYLNFTLDGLLEADITGHVPVSALLEHKKFKERLSRMCRHFAHNMEDSEDLYQQVCMKILKNPAMLKGVGGQEDFFTLLYVITKRTWIDEVRKRGRRIKADDKPVDEHILYDAEPDPYLILIAKEWYSNLSPRKKRVVELYMRDKSRKSRQLARGANCSHTTANNDLKEAMDSFLEQLHTVAKRKQTQKKGA